MTFLLSLPPFLLPLQFFWSISPISPGRINAARHFFPQNQRNGRYRQIRSILRLRRPILKWNTNRTAIRRMVPSCELLPVDLAGFEIRCLQLGMEHRTSGMRITFSSRMGYQRFPWPSDTQVEDAQESILSNRPPVQHRLGTRPAIAAGVCGPDARSGFCPRRHRSCRGEPT